MNTQDIDKRITGVMLQTGDFNQALNDMMEALGSEKEEIEAIIPLVKAREEIMATYIVEDTIAPRAEIQQKGFDIAVGILKSPMKYVSGNVRIILLFLYSKDNEELYISTLAYMIRLFISKSFRDALAAAQNEEEIEEMILDGLKGIED